MLTYVKTLLKIKSKIRDEIDVAQRYLDGNYKYADESYLRGKIQGMSQAMGIIDEYLEEDQE